MSGRRGAHVSLALGMLALVAGGRASAQTFWSEVAIPPLHDLRVPQPETYVLPNGLRVFLLEDRALPKVEATLLVRTGQVWEPADRAGLASITGQVMRTGGTTTKSGERINELLESRGATVETDIGRDAAEASMFTLAADVDLGLDILADLVRNPAFPEDKIALAKVQEDTAVARRNDDVGAIATREFRQALYGAQSPYARHTEHASIASISRADLVAFHRQAYWPGNAILGVVGDFDAKAMRALVAKSFGGWAGSGERQAMPKAEQKNRQVVYVVDKPDVAQTQFRLGLLGGRRDEPDFYAMEVFTELFGGGGFSTRLTKEVRTRLGLAYSIYGVWAPEYERDGAFVIGGGTKNASTAQAMGAAMQVLRQSLETPPTAAELSLAKDSILNSFVFRFDSRTKIVRQLMEYAYHGYPADFLERYRKGIEAVTAEDVLQAARRNIVPERLVVLAVGKADEFKEELPKLGLGALQPVDITIPAPPAGVKK